MLAATVHDCLGFQDLFLGISGPFFSTFNFFFINSTVIVIFAFLSSKKLCIKDIFFFTSYSFDYCGEGGVERRNALRGERVRRRAGNQWASE